MAPLRNQVLTRHRIVLSKVGCTRIFTFSARLYESITCIKSLHAIGNRRCFRSQSQPRGSFGNYKLTETVWELLRINVTSAKVPEIQQDCSRPLAGKESRGQREAFNGRFWSDAVERARAAASTAAALIRRFTTTLWKWQWIHSVLQRTIAVWLWQFGIYPRLEFGEEFQANVGGRAACFTIAASRAGLTWFLLCLQKVLCWQRGRIFVEKIPQEPLLVPVCVSWLLREKGVIVRNGFYIEPRISFRSAWLVSGWYWLLWDHWSLLKKKIGWKMLLAVLKKKHKKVT